MWQNILFSMIFLSMFFKCAGQEKHQFASVKYLCSTKIEKGSSHEGMNTLYFNSTKSLFVHDEWPKENKYIGSGGAFGFIKGDSEGMSVFRNELTDSMFWKSGYGAINKSYIFKDTIPEISWNITSQFKTMSGLKCIKAVGEYGGRVYNVWYSPDIPAPFGPYKLGGLPGLILQADSEDGRVSYTFHSYEPDYNGEINRPNDGIIVTYEEFRDIRIRSLEKVEAKTGATHSDPPINYEIEKDKWNIFSNYKKVRVNVYLPNRNVRLIQIKSCENNSTHNR